MRLLFLLCLAANVLAVTPELKQVDTIKLGGEGRWDYMYADSQQHRLYVAHATQTEVVDTQTDKLLGTIADTNGVHGIAIAHDLGVGFTSNGRDNSVTVFDLATRKFRTKIRVGENPDAIIYDEANQRVVTFNGRSKDATVIDATSSKVVATVAIGGKPEFAQIGAAGNIYFNIEDTNELGVLDAKAAKLVARYHLDGCESPTGLAVDDTNRVYSVCDNHMMVISAADGKQIAQVAIGAGPDGVAWMDGYAYSANGSDGTITVVGEDATGVFVPLATVNTQVSARTIAVDTATHTLYLPAAVFKAAVPGTKRIPLPDTFRVLVYQSALPN